MDFFRITLRVKSSTIVFFLGGLLFFVGVEKVSETLAKDYLPSAAVLFTSVSDTPILSLVALRTLYVNLYNSFCSIN